MDTLSYLLPAFLIVSSVIGALTTPRLFRQTGRDPRIGALVGALVGIVGSIAGLGLLWLLLPMLDESTASRRQTRAPAQPQPVPAPQIQLSPYEPEFISSAQLEEEEGYYYEEPEILRPPPQGGSPAPPKGNGPVIFPVGQTIVFKMVHGPHAGRDFSFYEDEVIIGRSSKCRFQIKEPSISRKHARVVSSNGQWFIQDTNSSAGIRLNGEVVRASTLNNGDTIQLGDVTLYFFVVEEP